MPTIVQLPSGSYRAQVRVKGFKPQGATFPTREAAHAWGIRLEAQLTQRTAESVLAGTHSETTFADAYALYLSSPAHTVKAASTRDRERDAAAATLRLIGSFSLSNLDAATLQTHFFDKRVTEKNARGKPVSGDTVRLEKALISSVFTFARKRGLVKFNPALGASFDMPRLGVREVRISLEEESRLYLHALLYATRARANPCLYPWLSFIFGTGTRPGEAAAIRLEWCDFDKREIRVPRASHKTRRPRVILLHTELAEELSNFSQNARAAGSPYLFYSQRKGVFMPYRYSTPWRAVCRLAGVSDAVVPHGVRHEFISRLFEKTTLSDSQVASLVGDVHVLSLKPYTHLRAHALRDQHDAHSDELHALLQQEYSKLFKPRGGGEKVNTEDLKSSG